MKHLILLPLLIPLVTAVLTLFARNRRVIQRALSICGGSGLLAAGIALLHDVWLNGIQTVQIGNWPAPFGITMVADLFSALMTLIAGLTGLAVLGYSMVSTDIEHETYGYHPLIQVLLLGVCGSFLTGDLFNLFVWFEVMLIASFGLLTLGGHRGQMEGAMKYVALNLISSMLFLIALGILYGVTGTLNMADLSRHLHTGPHIPMYAVLAMLFLVAFGIKSAIFPLFFWLPASYHTPPVAVSAIFSALLTKVGVYVLMRIFTLLFTKDLDYSHGLIMLLAGLTMVTGVLGAVAQYDFRRLLSFHIVSQIGYLLMGLAIATPLALTGAIFFMVHVIVAKAALFLVSGMVQRMTGTYDLKKLGSLYRLHPGTSFLFLLPALSLAGIPPLSGFWAKFTLIKAAIDVGNYWIVAVALMVSILTLYSMTKIWGEAFWKEAAHEPAEKYVVAPSLREKALLAVPTASLALLTLLIGLAAEPVLALSSKAAGQLLDRSQYELAVLGNTP